jgi:hypothetical protein
MPGSFAAAGASGRLRTGDAAFVPLRALGLCLGFATALAFVAGLPREGLAGFFDFGLGAVLDRVAMSLWGDKNRAKAKESPSSRQASDACNAHLVFLTSQGGQASERSSSGYANR